MSGVIDSPFFKAFAATNSLILGAGALYLAVTDVRNEGLRSDKPPCCSSRRLAPPGTFQSKRNDVQDVEEFSKALSNWNDNLVALEDILRKKNDIDRVDGIDQVDGVEVAGYHHSPLILEELDKTLDSVMGKVSQLRQLLRERHSRAGQGQEIIISQDFTGAELLLFRDEDSEADSFLSAASDIEDEDDDILTYTDKAKQKALEMAGCHRDKTLYVTSLELHFNSGVKCRKKRTKMVGCSSDTEFMAKVHCIREASKLAFADEATQQRLEKNTEDLLGYLIKTAGKDHHECQRRWKALVSFCRLPENWKVMDRELRERGVPCVTFYDVVLDFIVMDAFEDLENPPYSVQAAVQNGWLPTYIQQTGLETAVWGVLKAKMQMLQEPAGFLMHFYHLSEILTPVLAWGFLGSDRQLTKACNIFKEQMMGYVQDLFEFHSSDYFSIESLSKDISRLADERYENLRPLLSQPLTNGT